MKRVVFLLSLTLKGFFINGWIYAGKGIKEYPFEVL